MASRTRIRAGSSARSLATRHHPTSSVVDNQRRRPPASLRHGNRPRREGRADSIIRQMQQVQRRQRAQPQRVLQVFQTLWQGKCERRRKQFEESAGAIVEANSRSTSNLSSCFVSVFVCSFDARTALIVCFYSSVCRCNCWRGTA